MKGHDATTRLKMDAFCEQIAKVLLEVGHWRDRWRVEVDGCVFKINIDGYPKKGTPRWQEREREIQAASEIGD